MMSFSSRRRGSQPAGGSVRRGGAGRLAVEALESRTLLSADAVPPAASIITPDVTVGGGAEQIMTVTYTDNVAIDRTTVGHSDVTLTGPNGVILPLKTVLAYPLTNAPQVVATYVFTAPNGSWQSSDNGTWTATVLPGSVYDTSMNVAPSISRSFTVNIPPGSARDATPPTASIAPPASPAPGAATTNIQVTYSDNVAIDPSTIDTGNVHVFGPDGRQLKVTSVSESPSPDGRSAVATYTVGAPNGSWGPKDVGTYTVEVLSAHVSDTSGNPNPQAGLTFDFTGTAPTGSSGPLATISPPSRITTAGAATQTVTITYRSAAGVNVSSISPANLFVSRSGGPALAVTGVSVAPASGGAAVTATYTLAAPGGAWGPTDNGTYVVTVQPNQVTDLAGNAAATFSGSFEVAVPSPKPTVDPTLNGSQPGALNFVAEDSVTLPDGRIILAGRQGDLTTGSSQAVLERLNPDGSLDPTFGAAGTGKVVTPVVTDEAYFAVRLEPDGSIVTAGTHNLDFAVTRYLADGRPDPHFGFQGVAQTPFGFPDSIAYALAIAPDGSIVAGGTSDNNFALARYLSSGRPDTTFGQKGLEILPAGATPPGAGPNARVVGNLSIAPDGTLYAAGASGAAVDLIRLSSTGAPDAGFGTAGVLTLPGLVARTDLLQPDRNVGLALQADGKVLVAKHTPAGHFGVQRVNPNGSLDTTFGAATGTPGTATADFGGDDDADRVFVQGTGEILAVGTTNSGGTVQTAIAAFTPAGALDTAFGTNGQLAVPAGITPVAAPPAAGSSAPLAIHIGDLYLHAFGALQAGGRLVAGTSESSAPGATTAVGASSLVRVYVPGSGLIGQFGATAPAASPGRHAKTGPNRKLSFANSGGTVVTLTVKGGGSGQAFSDGNNIDLVLTGTTAHSIVSLKTSRAASAAPFVLRNVACSGSLAAFNAPTVNLAGTLSVPGTLKQVVLAALTGTIAAAGPIGSLTVGGNATGATVLSGTTLGSDGQVGGTGAAADAFAAGSIARIRINGAVTGSLFAAGLNPGAGAAPGALLNAGATVLGGASSRIGSITVKGAADPATRFVAGAFGTAKLPKKMNPATDPMFEVL